MREAEGPVSAAALDGQRVLLDCRLLGPGGAGRVTELLLRGLREIEPSGHWTLWGPEGVQEFLWPGAIHQQHRHPPQALKAQRALLEVPPHDIALYMHQIRPLRPGRSAGFIHDTIPLRYGASPASRRLKRLFLMMVARLTTHIFTDSQFSRRSIEHDLGVPASKITVVQFPVDPQLVDRVHALRGRLPQRETVLYVGRYAPHKNVKRLIVAFSRTQFAKSGGDLLLVGGTASEVSELCQFAWSRGVENVTIETTTPQPRLEALYATCRLLIMPSLEEGFGLPAWEAMTCGLPVTVSDGGSLPEIASKQVHCFPARSVERMTAAIDVGVAEPYQRATWPPPDLPRSTTSDLAATVLGTLARSVT